MPALAGYWIVSQTYYFKPTLAQTLPYAFPLQCAVLGILFSIVLGGLAVPLSHGLHVAISCCSSQDWQSWWTAQLKLENLSTVAIFLVLALITPSIVNRVISAEDVARKWLVPDESPLDRLLREAFERKGFVEVVNQSADAYIGRVVGPIYPWEWPDDIVIVPYIIGYRDPDTRKFMRTAAWNHEKKRTRVVLPRSSVVSVTRVVPKGLAPPRDTPSDGNSQADQTGA